MRTRRVHRKVMLAWGRWWAVQLVLMPELGFGIRLEPRRPMVDLYLGPITLAVGAHPVLTDPRTRHSDRCRGFLLWDDEVL